jgi:transposase InsO family protein
MAAPPARGELAPEVARLAAKTWRHPTTGEPKRLSRATIERWYYQALAERRDPVQALARKVRSDSGRSGMSAGLRDALLAQHRAHPGWSYRLHADNLAVIAASRPELGPAPSYRTVLRFMASTGLVKRRRRGPAGSPGAERAERRFEHREVRSYESEYVNALWHTDFHHGSARVLLADGAWAYPVLLGVLDDHSRLCCHAQWYLAETAETLVHGFIQAVLKRGLPRSLMSDNGSPMLAAETTQGLERLGVVHETTLPYSPYQNGKQESFWGRVEGRLVAMLEGAGELTLSMLNDATVAWCEMEYNRAVHSELAGGPDDAVRPNVRAGGPCLPGGDARQADAAVRPNVRGRSPIESFMHDRDVGRPAPSMEELRLAFTARARRLQRRSDGTVSVSGVRFEVPSRYAHMGEVHLRCASWDLSHVHLCDPKTGKALVKLYPQDKRRNAEAERRVNDPPAAQVAEPAGPAGVAPLLRKLLEDYASTGLPPAYLPRNELKKTGPSDGSTEGTV